MSTLRRAATASSGAALIPALLLIALFGTSPLWAVPMVAGLWTLVLKDKGYLRYAGPLFLVTNTIFFINPQLTTGLLAILPLIALAGFLPARRKGITGQWQLASKDGKLFNWLLPAGPEADTGAITGDASIHLIIVGIAVIVIGCYQAGLF